MFPKGQPSGPSNGAQETGTLPSHLERWNQVDYYNQTKASMTL